MGDSYNKDGSQKLKILYLMKILLEKTDEDHPISMEGILAELDRYGISAERKSVYSDFRALEEYGIDIIKKQENRNCYYYIGTRQFELAELKLLVDSVQSARFISNSKSEKLIKKLEGLASENEAKQLQHQVFVTERVKTQNEKILYNINAIHLAIEAGSVIRFRYFDTDIHKKQVFRHDGAEYTVSPWALTQVDENYYMISYDEKEDKIKYFRTDKMDRVLVTGEPRKGKKRFREFDVADYAKKRFGMYDGPEKTVKLRCKNSFAGVIFDRFGKNVILHEQDDGYFTVNVNVAVSNHFYAWVFAMNDFMSIIGPDDVLEDVRKFVEGLRKEYDR